MRRPLWRAGHRPRLSFRALALLLVVISVVPLAVLSGLVLRRFMEQQLERNEARVLELARGQAAEVDREFAGTIRTLQALADSERLDQGDLTAFHREASRVAATQDWWTVTLFDAAGVPMLSTGEPAGTAPAGVVDEESLVLVRETRAPVIGRLRNGPDGTFAFPVRVPVLRGESLRYVLTAVVATDAFRHMVTRRLPEDEEWTRTIFDPGGTIVARTREPDVFVGQTAPPDVMERFSLEAEGLFRDTRAFDGTPVLAAYARGPMFGWVSAVNVRAGTLASPLQGTLVELLVLSVLALLLTGGGVAIIARRISEHLGATADAARRLARGEPFPPLRESRIVEFDAVAAALRQSSTLLEERERERDEHLARAEEARRAAEAAERRKDEFLAMLGHELRNPLAPMMTALRLMKMRDPAWTREHQVLERQVNHLRTLVDDLLDVARITRGDLRLRMDPLDLREVVQRAAEMVAPALDERRHQLEIQVEPCRVTGDAARLAQVFANLLGNAAKYTPPGGHIRVHGGPCGSRVEVAVTDTGQGMAPDFLPRIFDVFWQGARTADRREGGLGVGLAIVRHLVQRHGGSIEARSDGPGQGSTFIVSLPAAAGAEIAAAPTAAGTEVHAEPSRILVVDDNRDAADTLADVLRRSGHVVQATYDAAEALHAARTLRPHVAILDIGLPVMDGYELAQRIRDERPHEAPLMIAVTGYGQPRDAARSRTLGFAAHLVKPVDPDELAARIATHRPPAALET